MEQTNGPIVLLSHVHVHEYEAVATNQITIMNSVIIAVH